MRTLLTPLIRVDPVVATILIAVIGALGALGGYWLNSRLTTRRERWAFKRDLYVRLLDHLHEAMVVLDTMVTTRAADQLVALVKEVEEIRRARAVAALFLHRETSQAIDQLDTTWRSLRGVQANEENVLQQRGAALRAAYNAVLKFGRADLGL